MAQRRFRPINYPAGASALGDLSDVVLTAPASTEIIQFDGSDWVNSPVPSGADPLRLSDGSVGAPTYSFSGATNWGMWRSVTTLRFSVAGATVMNVQATGISTNFGSGATMVAEVPTGTNPVFSFAGDFDTGIGTPIADQLSLIAGGFEMLRLTEDTTNVIDAFAPISLGDDLELRFGTGDDVTLDFNGSNFTTAGPGGSAVWLVSGFMQVRIPQALGIIEDSTPDGNVASVGQHWVRNDNPQTPLFRDGDGTDLQPQMIYTRPTTAIEDITNPINTHPRKVRGFMIYNSTTDTPIWAVGAADGSVWVDGVGTTVHTPV